MPSLYPGGTVASNFFVGTIREIVASRQNFPFGSSTEAITFSNFRKPVELTIDTQKTTGIWAREYADLYTVVGKIPELLFTPKRLRAYYLLAKEPSNLRAKFVKRDASVQYANFIQDTGTPSVDGSTENGSTLVAFNPHATIDNTNIGCELDFTGGMTPGEYLWLCNNAGSAQTGGSGGTGSLIPALTNNRTDRGIAGIYRVDIGGTQVNLLTKENCKWDFQGVIPADRKSYNDLQFVNSFKTTATIEMMGTSFSAEVKQSILDEISSAGTMPAVTLYCQSAAGGNGGIQIQYEAQTCTVVPKLMLGDDKGNLTIELSYEAQFNSNEATPDSMDFGVTAGPNIIKFLAL